MTLDHYLTLYTKINSKWIRIKCKNGNHKTPEEKISNTLFGIGLSNNFLDMSPQARETKAKINKYKLKICTTK